MKDVELIIVEKIGKIDQAEEGIHGWKTCDNGRVWHQEKLVSEKAAYNWYPTECNRRALFWLSLELKIKEQLGLFICLVSEP